MSELQNQLSQIEMNHSVSKQQIVDQVSALMKSDGYTIVERNDQKPWGAYLRLDNSDADSFVNEFFPGLDPVDARLGNVAAELSPKILLVSPNQRLSWQYHDRRAERWVFLTAGGYNKSMTDDEGELKTATAGEIVQFIESERHRLVGRVGAYAIVAEIWQHTDPDNPSNENDIVRLQDDYSRD
ncbi:MAG TPA: phosphoheptose isomerase [Candidatus Saccharibacteria bacterium]|nr:phosphoheptose isomerase [Candidatus Saccharibacteria bacterium]HRQ07105.1 phosphoheptose isomerase [Candidatus Saccharibacteria bacterium]